MGKGHALHRKTATAASLLIVIGLGGLVNGIYRMLPKPQKAGSAVRRERRAAMRRELELFSPSGTLVEADRREAEIWSVTLTDGLPAA